MERNAKLDATRGARAGIALVSARCVSAILGLLLLISCSVLRVEGQCASGAPEAQAVHALYSQQKWDGVVAAAEQMTARTADVNFELGMALPPRGAAALGLWQIARAAGLIPNVESGQAGR